MAAVGLPTGAALDRQRLSLAKQCRSMAQALQIGDYARAEGVFEEIKREFSTRGYAAAVTQNATKVPLSLVQLLAQIHDIAKTTTKAVQKRMSRTNATSFVRMRAAFKRITKKDAPDDDEFAAAHLSAALAEFQEDREAFEAARADEVAELQKAGGGGAGGDDGDSSDFGSTDSDDDSSSDDDSDTETETDGETTDGSASGSGSGSDVADTDDSLESEPNDFEDEEAGPEEEVRKALHGRWKFVKLDLLPAGIVEELPSDAREKLQEVLTRLASGGRKTEKRLQKVAPKNRDDVDSGPQTAMRRFAVSDYWLAMARECEAMPQAEDERRDRLEGVQEAAVRASLDLYSPGEEVGAAREDASALTAEELARLWLLVPRCRLDAARQTNRMLSRREWWHSWHETWTAMDLLEEGELRRAHGVLPPLGEAVKGGLAAVGKAAASPASGPARMVALRVDAADRQRLVESVRAWRKAEGVSADVARQLEAAERKARRARQQVQQDEERLAELKASGADEDDVDAGKDALASSKASLEAAEQDVKQLRDGLSASRREAAAASEGAVRVTREAFLSPETKDEEASTDRRKVAVVRSDLAARVPAVGRASDLRSLQALASGAADAPAPPLLRSQARVPAVVQDIGSTLHVALSNLTYASLNQQAAWGEAGAQQAAMERGVPPGPAAFATAQGDQTKSEAAAMEWRRRVRALLAGSGAGSKGGSGAEESKAGEEEEDEEDPLAGLEDDLKDDGDDAAPAAAAPKPASSAAGAFSSSITRKLRQLGPSDQELGVDLAPRAVASATEVEAMPRATRSPDATSGDFAQRVRDECLWMTALWERAAAWSARCGDAKGAARLLAKSAEVWHGLTGTAAEAVARARANELPAFRLEWVQQMLAGADAAGWTGAAAGAASPLAVMAAVMGGASAETALKSAKQTASQAIDSHGGAAGSAGARLVPARLVGPLSPLRAVLAADGVASDDAILGAASVAAPSSLVSLALSAVREAGSVLGAAPTPGGPADGPALGVDMEVAAGLSAGARPLFEAALAQTAEGGAPSGGMRLPPGAWVAPFEARASDALGADMLRASAAYLLASLQSNETAGLALPVAAKARASATTAAVNTLASAVLRHCAIGAAEERAASGSGEGVADAAGGAASGAGSWGGAARESWTTDLARRCLLFQVFCLAMDGSLGEALALRAGSAPLEAHELESADAEVQVLNNRAQVALGLAAFKRGEWQRALDHFRGFEHGHRFWPLVGQAVGRDRTRDITDKQALARARRDLWEERRRLVPAHRWLPDQEVEAALHFSAMVVETPRRARVGTGGRSDDRTRAFLNRLRACVADWRGSARLAGQGTAAAEAEAAAAAAAEVGSGTAASGGQGTPNVAASVAAAGAAALLGDDGEADGGSARTSAAVSRAGGAGAVAASPATVCEKQKVLAGTAAGSSTQRGGRQGAGEHSWQLPPSSTMELAATAGVSLLDGGWRKALQLVLQAPGWDCMARRSGPSAALAVKRRLARAVKRAAMECVLVARGGCFRDIGAEALARRFGLSEAEAFAAASRMVATGRVEASWAERGEDESEGALGDDAGGESKTSSSSSSDGGKVRGSGPVLALRKAPASKVAEAGLAAVRSVRYGLRDAEWALSARARGRAQEAELDGEDGEGGAGDAAGDRAGDGNRWGGKSGGRFGGRQGGRRRQGRASGWGGGRGGGGGYRGGRRGGKQGSSRG